jgi:hypothetical protein
MRQLTGAVLRWSCAPRPHVGLLGAGRWRAQRVEEASSERPEREDRERETGGARSCSTSPAHAVPRRARLGVVRFGGGGARFSGGGLDFDGDHARLLLRRPG